MDVMLQKNHGFTLLELIIVLIIISTLAVFVMLPFPASTINLAAQTEQVANDIRYTQSLSMTKGERYRFVKTSSTTYQIVNSSGSPILLARGSNTATLSTGITFGTLTNLPNNLIAFDSKGIPYVDTGSPGTALSSNASIPLTTGSETKTIIITPETGRVTIQ